MLGTATTNRAFCFTGGRYIEREAQRRLPGLAASLPHKGETTRKSRT